MDISLIMKYCRNVKSAWNTKVHNVQQDSTDEVLHCVPSWCILGMASFLLYSVHEGIRGIPLDPADKSDALVPVSGTSLAVGIDFHAGEYRRPIYISLLKPFHQRCLF